MCFVGRRKELQKLALALERGRHVIVSGPYGSGRTCHFRLATGGWYMPVALSDTVVFCEVMTGSNAGGEATEYAPWSPEEGDRAGIAAFLKRVTETGSR